MLAAKKLWRHWMGFGWGLMILVITGIPGQMIPHVGSFLDLFAPDKLVHLFLFGGFVLALLRGFMRTQGMNLRRAQGYSILICIGLGILTEVLQWKVFINREGSIWDLIADIAGGLLGVMIFRWWKGFFLKDTIRD